MTIYIITLHILTLYILRASKLEFKCRVHFSPYKITFFTMKMEKTKKENGENAYRRSWFNTELQIPFSIRWSFYTDLGACGMCSVLMCGRTRVFDSSMSVLFLYKNEIHLNIFIFMTKLLDLLVTYKIIERMYPKSWENNLNLCTSKAMLFDECPAVDKQINPVPVFQSPQFIVWSGVAQTTKLHN